MRPKLKVLFELLVDLSFTRYYRRSGQKNRRSKGILASFIDNNFPDILKLKIYFFNCCFILLQCQDVLSRIVFLDDRQV